jgi:hypothetical protein
VENVFPLTVSAWKTENLFFVCRTTWNIAVKAFLVRRMNVIWLETLKNIIVFLKIKNTAEPELFAI